MEIRFRVKLSDVSLSGLEDKILRDVGEEVRSSLATVTPSKRGRGRWGIRGPGNHSVTIINDVPYLPYLERGTGIHGPSGVPIRPKHARYLSWVSSGTRVFARSVKGMKAQPFVRTGVTRGLDAWRQKTT